MAKRSSFRSERTVWIKVEKHKYGEFQKLDVVLHGSNIEHESKGKDTKRSNKQ